MPWARRSRGWAGTAGRSSTGPRWGEGGAEPALQLDLCRKRSYHEKFGGHHYFLRWDPLAQTPSWREPWTKFEDWDWFNGRNYCRERWVGTRDPRRCMDLVSFNSAEEYRHFARILHTGRRLHPRKDRTLCLFVC